jgi:hypothetical protein
MICKLPLTGRLQGAPAASSGCEHRSVAPDGRIVCHKIAWGENKVSPNLCRSCPGQAVNCAHLRFSLHHSPPSSLLVRCSGRTEVWTDDRPALAFQQAACALQVIPLHSPRSCASCALREPVAAATLGSPGSERSESRTVVPCGVSPRPEEEWGAVCQSAEPRGADSPALQPAAGPRPAAQAGKIVPFPVQEREPVAATG